MLSKIKTFLIALLIFVLFFVTARFLVLYSLTGKFRLSDLTTTKRVIESNKITVQDVEDSTPRNLSARVKNGVLELRLTIATDFPVYILFADTYDLNKFQGNLYKTLKEGPERALYIPVGDLVKDGYISFFVLVEHPKGVIPYGWENDTIQGPLKPYKIAVAYDVE